MINIIHELYRGQLMPDEEPYVRTPRQREVEQELERCAQRLQENWPDAFRSVYLQMEPLHGEILSIESARNFEQGFRLGFTFGWELK